MQEETFGPLIPMASFTTEDQAVQLANDSQYGLAAIVCTCAPEVADRVSRQLEVGIVGVNQWQGASSTAIAAGHQNLGYGLLFMGAEGRRQFTAPKAVFRDTCM